ncbi:MAG: CusA/CzcA family heavy metal efflux RND transporter, partial [Flavobacteriales bacterium]|nr:CusA/CzcA family heavy metal efflux RND transporter [Flavobacteriales bacterium]
MLDRIIHYSIHHKLIVLLFSLAIIGFGIYALTQIPIGAVPDVTNNQVQIITTSRDLATEDVEKFLTYPVELEMANLPDVKEIRSISKFGLSVVTVVFEDRIGTYLPRQLISEKIQSATEKIPQGFGAPFMGPISTGLGEIYQYVLEVDSAHRDQYSLMDLRTIQDWVVKRQLSGIPGVVEVNTWGGFLKQYEVALNPEKLRSLNLSVEEVYAALESNNQVAGGGYIEKTNQAYFIRSEGMIGSLDDIRNIVITRRMGIPMYIGDIAEVGYGNATRFGAITGNGEGEKVLGQVMMLKGANSKAVIEAVKNRVAHIQSSLPPGVSINGFLERSELIGKTTFTIAENLILGCLIVIFVVVLLLGNLRSGLVVASVIPLCLLFALSLMYLFGVDANLMSLGAIDFGIIIDGAVIIVEYIAFKITDQQTELAGLPGKELRNKIDKTAHHAASKMMHSAVFGQLIIIMVFIPVLSLVGVEGKMFRPMALVFCFALIGAMILCFTYVPVMASLFIKPADSTRKTVSTRLISFLQSKYYPSLRWALGHQSAVLFVAIGMFVGVGILFSRMGGEFVPTLDEGDFVIQPVLKTGTTLSKTVEITTQIEQILMGFPEVDQVVSRIGAAEVPTDPMSMEESDVIIKLHPRSEWKSAESKDELADKFKEALSVLPGIEFEFTQPIEMRFNELITGVRADLAIKVFGEDLEILHQKAQEIEEAIRDIPGAADVTVEKIAGLPQMSVTFDRKKIARYGLNIVELNNLISMGFAGKSAGTVFEGEKQFDLVVRYDEAHRVDIDHLRNASINLPDGGSLPLSEFATIALTKGPAKISRDNTQRRIVVGVNVRNRDLESVVQDVRSVIERDVQFPAGYVVEYGGQFENLRTARERLSVAVPIALLLIFILLYFAFNSVREALVIFSAIPLSAVGGILLLYIRDLPFSISAGVGFIALFGIAVLNGIVLIEEFKELNKHGISDINERVLKGTANRLRPVLLTATAAALGFLPMAISTSAGAEVQRPLATVVIGGLVSATFLTLIVLPVLYSWSERKKKLRKAPLVMVLLALTVFADAQQPVSMDTACELALKHNQGFQASAKWVYQQEKRSTTGWNLDKTEVYFNRDQNNIAPNNYPLDVYGIRQNLEFPTVYVTRTRLYREQADMARAIHQSRDLDLRLQVSLAYVETQYWTELSEQYHLLDSTYSSYAKAVQTRYNSGETGLLEYTSAVAKSDEYRTLYTQSLHQLEAAQIRFNGIIQSDELYTPSAVLQPLPFDAGDTIYHPGTDFFTHGINASQRSLSMEKQGFIPDLGVSVFRGMNKGPGQQVYSGFEIGIAIPLWFRPQHSQVKMAQLGLEIALNEAEQFQR